MVKGKAGCLVRAISVTQFSRSAMHFAKSMCADFNPLIREFCNNDLSPKAMLELENAIAERVREFARCIIEWIVDNLEPTLQEMPANVIFQDDSYRRIAEKTPNKNVLSRFGKICLKRARYRKGRKGKTIFPIEIVLGIENGFTPAAADITGKRFAASGSTQSTTREMIHERFGQKIGNEKLRRLTTRLATSLEPLRQDAQRDQLIEWIEQARQRGGKTVLSVSRDGVSLGLAPWSIFEMAGVACVSVLSDGKKLGTVYLARAPQENQETLSGQLTSLLRVTIQACAGDVPEVVYVTDAGKIETAYWKNVLRHFFVDGNRIKITRVVDYYHGSERLTTIADALKVDSESRNDWLARTRITLLEVGGHGRVLRSIAKMKTLYGYKVSRADEAEKAERYLRRYKRFMNYAWARNEGYPIGSGVVESACKQIVSQRLKLSGMRWHREGAQVVMTLRSILLSKIWDTIFEKWLETKPAVSDLMQTTNC